MKNKTDEELERQPLAVSAKVLEMKKASEEANRTDKALHLKEVMKESKTIRERVKAITRRAAAPISTKLKQVHSLGDFYGKFHPSKSSKGIKRSE